MIGKFKDEANGRPIIEFIALRPKMYSFIIFYSYEREEEKHRAKGIRQAVSKDIRHQKYKEQLKRPVENYIPNQPIGSKLHQLYSIEVDLRDTLRFTHNWAN